jgi:hypothetical protein
MNPGNVAVTVIILSIFQVVGGLGVGAGLTVLRARQLGGLGGIVGGSLIGGLTIALEVSSYLAGIRNVLLLLVGPTVFVVTIFIRVFLWDSLVEELDDQPLRSLAPGAVYFVLALIAIPAWLDKGMWFEGLLWTGIMTVFGINSIRTGQDDLRRTRTTEDEAQLGKTDEAKRP